MKTKILFLFLLIPGFCFISCNKDKWKEPTKVSFTVDINRTSGQNGKLVFSGGKIVLGDFIFDGDRVQGDDVYFSNPYSSGLSVTFDPSAVMNELAFDIPQGTYSKIMISFTTSSSCGSNQIVTEGTYTNGGTNYPIRFEYRATQTFSIMSQNKSGSSEIVLKKDNPVTTNIVFDPIYWFQPVSQMMLNNADLTTIGGTPTILISDTSNVSIYSIVANRIGNGSRITFN